MPLAVQLYRVLADSSPDAIVAIDEASTIVSVNGAAERLFGYPAAELLGHPLAKVMPSRFHAGHAGGMGRYLATGTRRISWQGVRVSIRTKAGREVPVEVSFGESVVDGQRVFAGYMRDVSERAQRERDLAEAHAQLQEQAVELEHQVEEAQALTEELEHTNEELQRTVAEAEEARGDAEAARARITAILDSLGDVVVSYDARWRWTYANPAAVAMMRALGKDPDRMLGQVVWDTVPELLGTPFETETRRAVAEGRVLEYREYLAAVDRWLENRIVPGPDGAVTTFSRDVTAQHRAVEAIRMSETRYRALVEASTLMVWSTDASGMVDDMPGWRALTGQTPDAVRGSGWADAIHIEDRAHVTAAWGRALQTRELYEVEYRLRLADGGYRWHRARGAPVLDREGTVREWVGVLDDVDDERRAEDARTFLERASEALAATLTVDDALTAVARIAVSAPGGMVDAFADGVAIDVPRPGGGFRRVAVDSRDPAKSELVNQIERAYPTPEDAPAGYARVMRTGESELIEDMPGALLPLIARDATHLAMLEALDMYSAIVVPLRSRDATLGAVTLVLTGPARRRKYDARDLSVAEELARRVAIALDNASRYETERVSAERARRLLAVSVGLSEATTPEQVADVIFREGMAAVGADAGSLVLVRGDESTGREFEIVRTSGFAQPYIDRYRRFPLHAGRPLSDAMLAGAPRLLTSFADWQRQYPETAVETVGLGYEAFAAVPIMGRGRALAGFTFSFREPMEFDESTRTFLATLGEQCGLALERARAFEAEHEARAFSSAILDSIHDAFVVLDTEFRYTFVNPQAETLFRRSAADMLGHSAWDVFPGSFDQPFGRAFRDALETQQPTSVEEFSSFALRWLEARVYPRTDGLTIVFQDVTARHRAQETTAFLAEASRLLSASLDYEATLRTVASSAVPRLGDWCAVDIVRDPTVAAWPPELDRLAVVHEDPAKIAVGMTLTTRYPTDWTAPTGMPAVLRDRAPFFLPVVTDAMLVAGARDAEHLALLRAIEFSSIIVVPLVARDRTLGALTLCMAESGRHYTQADLALAVDLAQRAAVAVDNARLFREAERAQREAEAANQAKSEFLGTMSHELRTPLNAVLGYVDLLDAEVRGPITEVQREDLSRIRRSAKVLMSLVNDVLNFARVEAGHVEFHLDAVPLDRVLSDLETLVAQPIRAKQIDYTHDSCGGGAWVVRADPERLKQILTNLLTNAIKFTPAGGCIALDCAVADTPAGAMLQLRVSDTGRGIPAEALGRIFEPFVQIDRHLTGESQQGVGLGLAIARDLARRMGGDLTAESTPGVGSTFTLTLPRA
jgi:PAS domain S-box-containing protein